MKKQEKTKLILRILLCLIILILLFAFSLLAGCPVRKLTGIPCPACGITRAYLSLFKGDLSGAFNYHPLFFLAVPAFILVIRLLGSEKEKSGKFTRLYKALALIILILFLSLYFIRLFTNTIP